RLAGITGVGGMGTAQEPRAVRICTGSAETTSFYIARHAVITLDWVFSVLTGELNLSHGSWPGCGGRLDWYTRGSPVWSTGRGVSLGTRKGFGHTLKWAKRPGRIQGRRSALKKPRWEPPSPSASEKGLWDSPETHGGAKLQAHGGSRTLPSKGPGRWTGQTEDQFWIDLRPSPDRFWIGRLTVSFGGDSHPITGSGWTTLRISSPLGSPMRALRLHCSASAAERRVNRAAKRARQAPPAQGTRPAPISGAVLRGDQLTPPQMVGVEHINRGDESSACRNGGCWTPQKTSGSSAGDKLTPPKMVGVEHTDRRGLFNTLPGRWVLNTTQKGRVDTALGLLKEGRVHHNFQRDGTGVPPAGIDGGATTSPPTCLPVLRGPPRKRHSAFWTRMIPVIHEESDEASDTSSTIDATSSISGFSTLPEILDTVFGALDRGRLPKAS
ncbi:hypothetical protein V495_01567, partial [Pseudogymnoascus sp. VKM F-4514 (FW-929)]